MWNLMLSFLLLVIPKKKRNIKEKKKMLSCSKNRIKEFEKAK
jgi:hypothetical protein